MARGNILALILAGGVGGRLQVLSRERAKPALPFAGVYRLIDFPLSNCRHSDLDDVWVVEQYLPHSLNDHLANGRPWDLDRTHGGLQLLPPRQGNAADRDAGGFVAGNADALYRNRRLIRAFDPELLLVLSADHLYTLDYRGLFDRHREGGADVTAVTVAVPPGDDPGRFGVVQADGGRITGFAYKPEHPSGNLIAAEIFVYNTRALLDTLEQLAAEKRDGEDEVHLADYGDRLLPRLVAEGRAREYRHEGYWRDVGTVESYWQAHMDLLSPEPRLNLRDPGWPILTRGDLRPPALVEATARIERGLISPGCTVRGAVARSVLAPGVVVEEGATVRDAVILHDAVIEAGATVTRAILDRAVRVGRGATVGARAAEGDAPLAVVGQRAVVAAGDVVPAGRQVAPRPPGPAGG
jgi:glucose-1-phosphate adenylyltransferase